MSQEKMENTQAIFSDNLRKRQEIKTLKASSNKPICVEIVGD